MDMLYSKILRCIKITKMKITEINASKIISIFTRLKYSGKSTYSYIFTNIKNQEYKHIQKDDSIFILTK